MSSWNPAYVAAFAFCVVVGAQLFAGHVGLSIIFALCAAASFAWGRHISNSNPEGQA